MMKLIFFIALGGVAAFYILKGLGYSTFAQVESDVRGAGKSISRTADDIGDAAKDTVHDATEEVK